jgi:hypothetical protein
MPTCLHGWGSDGLTPSGCPACAVLERQQLRAEDVTLRARLAALESRLHAAEEALRDCGTNDTNPDTCGVCGKHFAQCEEERWVDGDEDEPYLAKTRPACAGARARAALPAKEKSE